jgi:hypothetical protein
LNWAGYLIQIFKGLINYVSIRLKEGVEMEKVWVKGKVHLAFQKEVFLWFFDQSMKDKVIEIK